MGKLEEVKAEIRDLMVEKSKIENERADMLRQCRDMQKRIDDIKEQLSKKFAMKSAIEKNLNKSTHK